MAPVINMFSETIKKKFLGKKKKSHFGFVDLEKTFDSVPRDVVWWEMVCQGCARSCVILQLVLSTLSEEFMVKGGVHQGSVLGPLLFIIALLFEFISLVSTGIIM